MICLNCGGEIKIETGYEFKEVKVGHCYKCEVVIGAGLEKIEPLNPRNVSSEYWNATHENRAKLNEVIEKLNLVMDYLNKGVK